MSVFGLLLALTAQGWTVYASGEPISNDTKLKVSFWRAGDDGLTLRFFEALKNGAKHSKRVSEAAAGDPPLFRLIVTDHLRAESNDHVDRVRASVELLMTDSAVPLWQWRGSCDPRDFNECVTAAYASLDAHLEGNSQ